MATHGRKPRNPNRPESDGGHHPGGLPSLLCLPSLLNPEREPTMHERSKASSHQSDTLVGLGLLEWPVKGAWPISGPS